MELCNYVSLSGPGSPGAGRSHLCCILVISPWTARWPGKVTGKVLPLGSYSSTRLFWVVKSLMHSRWHNLMLLQVTRRCKHRHLIFRPVLLDGAPVCPHWYLSWFNPLALASCAPSHARRKQPSCLMHVMWADSETLSVRRDVQASEPLSAGRGTVATGCSFYAVHCPGKKGTGRCSSLTEYSRLCCWNKWHHQNPCVDRQAHARTHIHTFTKIKSIIDKNSKWCGDRKSVV